MKNMPYFLISFDTPTPSDLAEELGQRLLAKQIAQPGFIITAYGQFATMEFPNSEKGFIDKVESEAGAWIDDKHRSLRLRRLTGKRQKQSLGMPTDQAEEVVCLEIRK
jgi:hypothetical protein